MRLLPPLLTLTLVWLAGCSNPCVEMCQQADEYLRRCGYGWSTTFEQEGYASVDDCYDDYWDTPPEEQRWCEQQSMEYAERSCY